MTLTDQEKIEVQNLLKCIRRAKFDDFQGLEVLALARAYYWLDSLLKPEIATVVEEQPKIAIEEPKKKSNKRG